MPSKPVTCTNADMINFPRPTGARDQGPPHQTCRPATGSDDGSQAVAPTPGRCSRTSATVPTRPYIPGPSIMRVPGRGHTNTGDRRGRAAASPSPRHPSLFPAGLALSCLSISALQAATQP